MIAPDLMEILCCPETHQDLRLAEPAAIDRLNSRITAGTLKNRVGQPVREKLDAGLIRSDGKYLYPVRRGIPVMLVDEAIPLPG